ncbi:helix-turn-helix domain-containing protein [Streptomyces sp. NPDC050264]|uniref:TetR/AcrR family transcriptional regulator n=1 Tax=Streptomyces sp. NPDC050264 TaxID=3155038 RepID=UPI003413025F
MPGNRVRESKVDATREAILAAAERLFAEQGIYNVSSRRIGQAAGQRNTTAVTYHFGSKIDLMRAISGRHAQQIEQIRERLVIQTHGSARLRDWVTCMVLPVTEHLAALGGPTWYARFNAQVSTDPALYEAVAAESAAHPSVCGLMDGFNACLPDMPPEVHAVRDTMSRHLIVHLCLERERALADGRSLFRSGWHDTALTLIDALTGLWSAPVTRTTADV